MRSNWRSFPSDILRDLSIFPRSSRLLKMFNAGGQVPTDTEAPASARALAIAKPKPPSSATPATRARRPERSILSIVGICPNRSGEARGERDSICYRYQPELITTAGDQEIVERLLSYPARSSGVVSDRRGTNNRHALHPSSSPERCRRTSHCRIRRG